MDRDSTADTDSSETGADPASPADLLEELSVSDPDTGVRLVRRLKALVGRYLEAQQRAKALGIDSVEALVDAVDALRDRVDRLQNERDAAVLASDEPDSDESDSGELDSGELDFGKPGGTTQEDEPEGESGLRRVFNRFYQEMRQLHNLLGVDNNQQAIEAVRHLLAREEQHSDDETPSTAAGVTASAAGTTDPERIAQLLRDLQAQLLATHLGDAAVDDALDADPAERGEAPAVADDALVGRLESMSSDALNDLDVGAIAVNDTGEVLYANDAATVIPGLHSGLSDDGTPSFFDEVAPTTSHPFFRGRFERGVEAGKMDVAFRYVLLPAGTTAPLSLAVRLHSKPAESIHWILVRPL